MCVVLDSGTIHSESERVARVQRNSIPVGAGDLGAIVEAVCRIEPAVETAPECVAHAVRVARRVEWADQFLADIRLAVAVRITERDDVRNREADRSASLRINANRNVEAVRENSVPIKSTVTVRVLEDSECVERLPITGSCDRVLA